MYIISREDIRERNRVPDITDTIEQFNRQEKFFIAATIVQMSLE